MPLDQFGVVKPWPQKFIAGQDYNLGFAIQQPVGTPIEDLTGYSVRAEVKDRVGDGATVLDTFTAVIDDPVNAHITISLTETQTAALPDSAVYVVELSGPRDLVVLRGPFSRVEA